MTIDLDLGGLGLEPPKTAPSDESSPASSKLIPNNPLAEAAAEPVALDEVFSRDPFEYTAKDVSLIISELRRKRTEWEREEALGEKKPRAKKAAAKKSPKKTKDEAKKIELADLQIVL